MVSIEEETKERDNPCIDVYHVISMLNPQLFKFLLGEKQCSYDIFVFNDAPYFDGLYHATDMFNLVLVSHRMFQIVQPFISENLVFRPSWDEPFLLYSPNRIHIRKKERLSYLPYYTTHLFIGHTFSDNPLASISSLSPSSPISPLSSPTSSPSSISSSVSSPSPSPPSVSSPSPSPSSPSSVSSISSAISSLSSLIHLEVHTRLDSISLPSSLKTFKSAYIKSVENFPDSLTNLELCYLTSNLPPNLTHLHFHHNFIHDATNYCFPSSLLSLKGRVHGTNLLSFMDSLPPTLTDLDLSVNNSQNIADIKFPPSLLSLKLDVGGCKALPPSYPSSLLHFSLVANVHPTHLPTSLLSLCTNVPGIRCQLPDSIQKISFGLYEFTSVNDYPKNLTHLSLLFTLPPAYLRLPIPSTLTYLETRDYQKHYYLPKLTHLKTTNADFYPSTITHLEIANLVFCTFPASLTHLTITRLLRPLKSLPRKLQHLIILEQFPAPLPLLPETLTHLSVGLYEHPLPYLPPNLQKLSFEPNQAYLFVLPPLPETLTTLLLPKIHPHPLPNVPPRLSWFQCPTKYIEQYNPTLPLWCDVVELETQ